MFVSVFVKINSFNNLIFEPIDNLVQKIPVADWAIEAICDSIHLIPFLFFVFLIIEILEYFYADKINAGLKVQKHGVLIGAIAAIFPQCGFSVMASSLYIKRIITLGTLIAVYLATSDETIPILLAIPEKAHLIIPVVGVKLFIAVVMGYFIDFVIRQQKLTLYDSEIQIEEGCCKHDIEHGNPRELIIHPILHTFNIFSFILIITLVLNFCLDNIMITNYIEGNSFIQIVTAAFIGLIPNCAISIGLTMMLIKGTISFGAAMSGLLSNAGLGLLVLLKNNDFKDTLKIMTILLAISIVSGITINFVLQ